jgi:hypothetical protein
LPTSPATAFTFSAKPAGGGIAAENRDVRLPASQQLPGHFEADKPGAASDENAHSFPLGAINTASRLINQPERSRVKAIRPFIHRPMPCVGDNFETGKVGQAAEEITSVG